MEKLYEESIYLFKTSCDSCGSSDANAVYSDGGSHCFSCGKHTFSTGRENEEARKEVDSRDSERLQGLLELDIRPLAVRGINLNTVSKYKYGYNSGRQVANYYDDTGELVAQKIRTKNKEFSWVGNPKQAGLFGQHLWSPHPKKRIVITEGEIDCLSVSQAQDNKWAVVSLPNGAASAERDVRKHLEYLSGFDKVVICFDMDEPGRQAAQKVAALLPPNKAYIATLPLKDANEMTVAGRGAELIQCLWDAKKYKPDGILNGDEILDRLNTQVEETCYPLPDYLSKTNEKTKGIRLGNLDVFTSGTGMGKTTFIKQLQMHLYNTTDLNQAVIHLEEPIIDTINGLIGIELKRRLHLSEDVDQQLIKEKAKEIFSKKDEEGFYRFNIYDAFGSVSEEDLYNKIRFMVNGLGCKVIWLDHLSILVSGLGQDGDERRAIDAIMHNLKSLTVELKCYIGLIVHLNNATSGKTFEEGAVPNLNNLRGSGGIKQLSDTVYALSGNQQADSEVERNTRLVTVLKCRYTGMNGKADYIYYNGETGCNEAGEDPSLLNTAAADFGVNEFDT